MGPLVPNDLMAVGYGDAQLPAFMANNLAGTNDGAASSPPDYRSGSGAV